MKKNGPHLNGGFFVCLPLLCLTLTASAVSLEDGFRSPPDSAKPTTVWQWMNGNITKEGITADLEAMKQIGLGGVTIYNLECQIPAGNVPVLSASWRDDFRFALQEAARLGLTITLENCPGWATSGGPWNTPENAMQQMSVSELRVSGPTNFNAVLPQPPVTGDFYRDVAVLAFPVPAGEEVEMKDRAVTVSTSTGQTGLEALIDGNTVTQIPLPAVTTNTPYYIQLAFPGAFAAGSVKIMGGTGFPDCGGQILVSSNGTDYTAVKSFVLSADVLSFAAQSRVISLGVQQVNSRFWRIQFDSLAKNTGEAQNALAEVELLPRINLDDYEEKAGFAGTVVLPYTANDRTAAGIVQRGAMVDLSASMTTNGTLSWQIPAGKWVIMRFGHTLTGEQNGSAPVEGMGLECDKMSQTALDLHWAGYVQKILDDAGALAGPTLQTVHIDSWEAENQNWTEAFRTEFQARRGYDPLTFLPAFTGRVVDTPAATERFLWDVRRTIADLIADNYFGRFATLCRQKGLMSSIEPYTGPFESLQAGAAFDTVMGEFWNFDARPYSCKIAASIAHMYGKPVVAAEAFTAQPENSSWRNDPYSLKALGDQMFAWGGINRFEIHRYAMQPWTNRFPGMSNGPWGTQFERTLTWWNQGKAWMDYLARCQFLLQQGRPVVDVAYYMGESAPMKTQIGQPVATKYGGYNYDHVNADVLLHGATVTNGRLTLASGANYGALILPENDPDMTPQLLQRIAELVQAGLTLAGAPPQRSPSLAGFPACDTQVKNISSAMWGACDGTNVLETTYGSGRIVRNRSVAQIFAAQNLKPDFQFEGPDNTTRLLHCHRIADGADIYFVSNERDVADWADCTFRVSGKTPELWHPDTGVIERAPVWHEQDGLTVVHLTFDPAGSVFVVFRTPAAGDQVVTAEMNAQWQTFSGAQGQSLVRAFTNGTARFITAAGKTMTVAATNVPAPAELTGAWTLSFPPNLGAPASVTLDNLISWPQHTNSGVRYFSGTATYNKQIDIPAASLQSGRELWLELGTVKNLAEVYLNGQNLGILWKPPFRVNLTPAAVAGTNQLTVKVTNLWPNRLIGDEQLPLDYERNTGGMILSWPQWLTNGQPRTSGRVTFTTYQPWKKTDPLLDSGLLGPVMLQTAAILPMDQVLGLPSPWLTADIGTGIAAGSAGESSGVYTVAGAGNISGTADNFRFVYQTLRGDGEIKLRIPTFQTGVANARFGVMMRDTLAADSPETFMGVFGNGSFYSTRRMAVGGTTANSVGVSATAPNVWARLVRSGNTVTAYSSMDGTSWTALRTNTITMATNCYFGICVASGTTGTLNTATFDNLTVTPDHYEFWAAGYSLTGAQTNGTSDTDNDGLINLLEYAFGGNPVSNDAAAVRPAGTVMTADGSNAFVYVYKRRTDDPGMIYTVKLKTNLVNGVWDRVGRLYETATGATADPNVENVTNRIPAVEEGKFIGLEVIRN